MQQIRKMLQLTRPIQLLLSLMAYGLGLGLARYLGTTLLLQPQYVGGLVVIMLLAVSSLLTEYFRPNNEPIFPGETSKEREELRSILWSVSLSILFVVTILVFLLNRAGFINAEAAIILGLLIVLGLANAIPPVRFANRSLSELSYSIQICSLSPSLAFLLQYGSFHRLLSMFTFPLLLLALAYFLALNFPAYAEDLKYERKSLLISLTWQRAVPIHNLLLIVTYLFFAAIPFLGVPFGLVWPSLLTLPVAIYQIYCMRNLAEGAKPIWSVFVTTATITLGLTIYLIALTFWLR